MASPHKRVWALAAPLILSNMTVPLLGAVDTAVMGHLPDPAYIGGVTVGAMIFNFLFWGFGFLRMGTVGFSAQALGASDQREQAGSLLRPLLLSLVLGILLITAQYPLLHAAVALVDGSAQVSTLAYDYSAVRIWSAPMVLANYTMMGWLLGRQQARLTFVLQVLVNSVNIVLDLYFVVGLGWGVEGVALATAIAETCGTALGLFFVWERLRKLENKPDWTSIIDRARLMDLVKVNRDIFIRTLCLIFGFAYFTHLSAGLGDVALAANAVLMHFVYFAGYGLDGFAHAAEILAGHAKGGRNRLAFSEAVRASSVMAAVTASAFALTFWLAGPVIITLFTDIPEVRRTAEDFLPWLIVAPVVGVACYQLDGIFIGTTRTGAMRNAMIQSVIAYLLCTWIAIPLWGNHGLWFSLNFFLATRGLTLLRYYPALSRSISSDTTGASKIATGG